VLPLSIGDGELCETALSTVPVVEMFQYWLQGGRVTVGFLGGAQVDRFGNLNSTVVGPYERPKVRLPGSGGATEIAAHCRRIFIVMRHGAEGVREPPRFHDVAGARPDRPGRRALGLGTEGPALIVTDLCTMQPDPETCEFEVASLHPGVTAEQVREQTSWPLRFRSSIEETPAPRQEELDALRDLIARTRRAHGERDINE
jgi:glutaconate CoA-transferase subunit B